MPQNTNFLKAFEQERARFSVEWAALEQRESFLYHQYQWGQAQLQDQQCRFHQYASAQFQELQKQMAQVCQEAKAAKVQMADLQAKLEQAHKQATEMQT